MQERKSPRQPLPPAAEKMVLLALRLAATADGAPKRCRRMKCRAGRCMAETTCAGGLGKDVVHQAAWMIIFAAELVKEVCGVEAAEKFAPAAAPRARRRGVSPP